MAHGRWVAIGTHLAPKPKSDADARSVISELLDPGNRRKRKEGGKGKEVVRRDARAMSVER